MGNNSSINNEQQLYSYWNKIKHNPLLVQELKKKLEEFGRSGVPLYLLYPSTGKPIILPEILTEDILLNYLNELG